MPLVETVLAIMIYYRTKNIPILHVSFYNLVPGISPCQWIYFKDDRDSALSAYDVNMIGPLAEFVAASNSFKTVQRYFGKV